MVANQDTVQLILEAKVDGYLGPLRQAEKQAKELEKAIRAEEKALKEEASTLKQTGQAQGSLTKDKLLTIKAARDQVRALRENSQALRDQTRAMREGQSAAVGFGGSLKGTIATVAGLTVSVGGLSAAIAGVSSSITAFGNFERSLNTIAAVSEATDAQLKAIKRSALDLGQSTIFSNQQVADSYVSLAKAGFTAQESLEAMPGLLDLAAAAGGDLQNAAEIAAGTLRGFNKDASESARVADVLAQAAAKSSADISDLGFGMKQLAPVAVTANQSFEDMAALMAALSDRMIKGADAGSDLRAIMLRLIDPPSEAKKSLAALGVQVTDSAGKIRPLIDVLGEMQTKLSSFDQKSQAKIISDIAGLENVKSLSALLNTDINKLREYQDQMINAEGAAAKMAGTINQGVNRALEEFGGATETLAATLGEKLAPAATQALQGLTELAKGLTEAAEDGENSENVIIRLTTGIFNLGAAASRVIGPIGDLFNLIIDKATPLGVVADLLNNTANALNSIGSNESLNINAPSSVPSYRGSRAFSRSTGGGLPGPMQVAAASATPFVASFFQTAQKTIEQALGAKPAAARLGSGTRSFSSGSTGSKASSGYLPLMPVNGPITGRFGENRGDHIHSGIDYAAPRGTPVKAPIDGIIKSVGTQSGYGKTVVLVANVGGQQVEQLFAHLDGFNVRPGQKVGRGFTLGQVGSTGRSTGPHLHYEVKVDGKKIDPKKFLGSKITGLGLGDSLAGGSSGAALEPISQTARLLDAQKQLLDSLDEQYQKAAASLGGYATESQKAGLAIEAYNAKLQVNQKFLEAFTKQANEALGTKISDPAALEEALSAKQSQLTDAYNAGPTAELKKQIEDVKDLREAYDGVRDAIQENQIRLQEMTFQQQEAFRQQEEALQNYVEGVRSANRSAALDELENVYNDQKQALQDLYEGGKLSAEEYYQRLIALSDEYYTTQIASEQEVLTLLQTKLEAISAEIAARGASNELLSKELAIQEQINGQINKIAAIQNQQGRARTQIQRQQRQQGQEFANRLAGDIGSGIEQAITAALTGDGSTNAIKQFGETMKRVLINFIAQALGQLATQFIGRIFGANNQTGGLLGGLFGGRQGGGIFGSLGSLFGSGSGGIGGVGQGVGGSLFSKIAGAKGLGGVASGLSKGGKILGALAAVGAGALLGSQSGSPIVGGLTGLAGGAAGGFMVGGPVGAVVGAAVGAIGGVLGGIFGGRRKKRAKQVAAQHSASLLEQQRIAKDIFDDLADDELNLDDLGRRRSIAVRNAVGEAAEAQRTQNINRVDELIAQRKKQIKDFTKAASDANRELEQNLAIGAAEGYKRSALERQFALENLNRETQDLLAKYKDSESARTEILKSETLKRQQIEQQFTQSTKNSIANIEELLRQRDEIENQNVFTRAKTLEQIKNDQLNEVDAQILEALRSVKELGALGNLSGVPELQKFLGAGNLAATNYNALNISINGAQDPLKIQQVVLESLQRFFGRGGVVFA